VYQYIVSCLWVSLSHSNSSSTVFNLINEDLSCFFSRKGSIVVVHKKQKSIHKQSKYSTWDQVFLSTLYKPLWDRYCKEEELTRLISMYKILHWDSIPEHQFFYFLRKQWITHFTFLGANWYINAKKGQYPNLSSQIPEMKKSVLIISLCYGFWLQSSNHGVEILLAA
jgi:hypothetical protein